MKNKSHLLLFIPIIFALSILINKTTGINIFATPENMNYDVFGIINNYDDSLLLSKDVYKAMKEEVAGENQKYFAADSVIVGAGELEDGYYIKSRIKLPDGDLVLTYMRCNKEIFEKAVKEENQHSLVVMKIDSMLRQTNTYSLYDIENVVISVWNKPVIYLNGECVDIIKNS